ncbi:MAG: hypothetical protein QOF76_2225, partial [Solirubrobacteraceae bacterium]|nr:hypothetical protein [Solirubrobacteraceae bacterium]
GTGAFTESRGSDAGDIVMDVSENACAQTKSRGTITPQGVHTSVTDGLQLRVAPGPDGSTVPRSLAATATLDGGGAEITSYSAVFRGWRTDPSYELRLVATTTDGAKTVLAGCDAYADCNGLFAPGTLPGVDAPPARELFTLPAHTASLRWSLTCKADACPNAATHDADLRGQPAALIVYGSTATIGVPAAGTTPAPVPTPVTTPDTDPGAPVNPEFGSIFRFGNRSDIELACGDSLTVDRTRRDGPDMVVHGFAAENLIGHRIVVRRGKARVGTATVSTKRDWTARIPTPRGRPAHYVARSGPVRVGFLGPATLTLKMRRMRHDLLLRGRAPAHAHGLVVVQRLIGCGDWNAVAETKASRGRFRVRLPRPAARTVLLRATLQWHGRTLRSY